MYYEVHLVEYEVKAATEPKLNAITRREFKFAAISHVMSFLLWGQV